VCPVIESGLSGRERVKLPALWRPGLAGARGRGVAFW